MPKIKSWVGRIPLIIQHLEVDVEALYTRSEIETLFQVGKSQATDLMKIAGAEVRQGAEATVSRSHLLYYVQRCPEARAYLVELARKQRIKKRLERTAEDIRLKEVPIPGVTKEDEWTKWKDLPSVLFTAGALHIQFESQENLLRTLIQISKAMANEPQKFEKLCERVDAIPAAKE